VQRLVGGLLGVARLVEFGDVCQVIVPRQCIENMYAFVDQDGSARIRANAIAEMRVDIRERGAEPYRPTQRSFGGRENSVDGHSGLKARCGGSKEADELIVSCQNGVNIGSRNLPADADCRRRKK